MKDDKFQKLVDPAARLNALRGGVMENGESASETIADEIEEEEAEACSTRSGDRLHKMMLIVRFKDGKAKAFPYSFLVGIDFNPSKEIVMDFTRAEVRIEGRNLGTLFSWLAAHWVAIVQEPDDLHAEATGEKEKPIVTRITVEKKDS
jgi:hypothetical protein